MVRSTSSLEAIILRSRRSYNQRLGTRGLTFTVADTGGGMPPQAVKKVSDEFFTTKGLGGTGLGLWVSHGIIALHNGALRQRSSQKEGHSGMVFTVFLSFDASEALSPRAEGILCNADANPALPIRDIRRKVREHLSTLCLLRSVGLLEERNPRN